MRDEFYMMKREADINYINCFFAYVSSQIAINASLNLHDINIISEYVICNILNTAFGWELENANFEELNTEGYDLVDLGRKQLVQVTSTSTRDKIQKTLNKSVFAKYRDFSMLFILLTDKKPKYQNKPFVNLYDLIFDPKKDVWDFSDLSRKILSLNDAAKIDSIAQLIRKESSFSFQPSISRRSYLLAELLKSLLSSPPKTGNIEDDSPLIVKVDEKIATNNLDRLCATITDAFPYTSQVNDLLDQFDKESSYKTISFLSGLADLYEKTVAENADMSTNNPEAIFWKMQDQLVSHVMEDEDIPDDISREELAWGVKVILIEAFVRCRIFEGPDLREMVGGE